jgi:hypothetical protein
MADKIERLPEFIRAVKTEFDTKYPSEGEGISKLFLGEKIWELQQDMIDEEDYITEWLGA